MNHDRDRPELDHPFLVLDRPIATGAMGEVWRARHDGLGRDVAVKLLNRAVADHPEVRERFHGEARAASQIESPYVVRYHDYGVTHAGRPYIVMEWCEGVTLRDMLTERGALLPAQVALILRQLASALDAVHRAGVVHRDVKPENILLVPNQGELRIKLVDFGVSRDVNQTERRLTAAGSLVGTPGYMSREQVLYGESSTRSDIWALGVVAYELLTGRGPFDASTVGGVCANVAENAPKPLSRHCSLAGEALDAWFATATATNPDDRFDSAKTLWRAFESAIEDDVVDAGPPSAGIPLTNRRVPSEAAVSSLTPHVSDGTDRDSVELYPAGVPTPVNTRRLAALSMLVLGLGVLGLVTRDRHDSMIATARTAATQAERQVLLQGEAHPTMSETALSMAMRSVARMMDPGGRLRARSNPNTHASQ